MQLRIAAQSSQPARKRPVRLPEQNVYGRLERVEAGFIFMSLAAMAIHLAHERGHLLLVEDAVGRAPRMTIFRLCVIKALLVTPYLQIE